MSLTLANHHVQLCSWCAEEPTDGFITCVVTTALPYDSKHFSIPEEGKTNTKDCSLRKHWACKISDPEPRCRHERHAKAFPSEVRIKRQFQFHTNKMARMIRSGSDCGDLHPYWNSTRILTNYKIFRSQMNPSIRCQWLQVSMAQKDWNNELANLYTWFEDIVSTWSRPLLDCPSPRDTKSVDPSPGISQMLCGVMRVPWILQASLKAVSDQNIQKMLTSVEV